MTGSAGGLRAGLCHLQQRFVFVYDSIPIDRHGDDLSL